MGGSFLGQDVACAHFALESHLNRSSIFLPLEKAAFVLFIYLPVGADIIRPLYTDPENDFAAQIRKMI